MVTNKEIPIIDLPDASVAIVRSESVGNQAGGQEIKLSELCKSLFILLNPSIIRFIEDKNKKLITSEKDIIER